MKIVVPSSTPINFCREVVEKFIQWPVVSIRLTCSSIFETSSFHHSNLTLRDLSSATCVKLHKIRNQFLQSVSKGEETPLHATEVDEGLNEKLPIIQSILYTIPMFRAPLSTEDKSYHVI